MSDIISLYKPQVSIAEAFKVDETLPEQELAFEVFKKTVTAVKSQDLIFLSLGHLLKLMRDKKLYKKLDYENFSQYLNSEEISFSREKAYLYIKIYELYVDKLQLNPDEVGEIGVARLMMMVPVIKDMSKEKAIEKIEEGKALRYGDFVREVKESSNKTGKPTVYFREEIGKWEVSYYENTTNLTSLGQFKIELEEIDE